MVRHTRSEKQEGQAPRWVLMARRFYSQALVDLDTARNEDRPRHYYAAVFFAEQAAEKALKAAHWHLIAEEPQWTHRTERMALDLAERVGDVPQEILIALGELMSGLEHSRYPSGNVEEPIPADLVGEADAKAAVGHAEMVMTWVESLLRLPTGRPRRRRSS